MAKLIESPWIGQVTVNATDQRIAQILMQAGLVDQMQLRSAGARQKQFGGKIHDVVVDLGFSDEARVSSALAAALGMPRLKLDEIPIDPEALQRLPAGFCEQHLVLPCALRDAGKSLWVALSDPLDVGLADTIRAHARVTRVQVGVAGRNEIDSAIKLHYYGIKPNTGQDAGGGIELDGYDGEEEFKITDVSGATMVKHVPGLDKLRAQDAAAAAAPPPPVQTAASFASAPPPPVDSGAFASSADPSEATIKKLQQSIERSNKVLRAIVELCIQKGFFSVDEYRERVNR